MNFVPNGKRVLMKLKSLDSKEVKSESGFIITTGEKKEIQEAEVVNYEGSDSHSHVGATAFFMDGAINVKVSGESFLVIDTDKILGFLVK